MLKIDNSVLQAGALAAAAVIAVCAAIAGQWGVVEAALTGLFAVLSIHPKQPGSPPDSDA